MEPVTQALLGESMTVFGKGDQTRSFCFVSDLIEGIYRLLMSDHSDPVKRSVALSIAPDTVGALYLLPAEWCIVDESRPRAS